MRHHNHSSDLVEAGEAVAELIEHEPATAPAEEPKVNLGGIQEAVADNGYHGGSVLKGLHGTDCRSYPILGETQMGRPRRPGKGT